MSKDVNHVHDYIHADAWIDPEGDDFSPQQVEELGQQVEQLCACMDKSLVHPTWLNDCNEPSN